MKLWRTGIRVFIATFILLGGAAAASAQPWNHFLARNAGGGHGYIQLPATSALNFAGGSFTFEAWVHMADDLGCVSLAGNSFSQSTWIGICGVTLRSYFQGGGSVFDAGVVQAATLAQTHESWTHVAVTFDASTNTRRHYVDGELVGQRTDSGGITSSTAAWRILSDASWEKTPRGNIDEVRFWNVARTKEQIRANINREIHSAEPGLVAVYAFEDTANDSVGSNHGTRTGAVGYASLGFFLTGCTTSSTNLCIGPSGRFDVSVTRSPTAEGALVYANVVTALTTPESGIFWFFGANNWEVMVKTLNGCGLNSHYWLYAAGLTDQHFKITVYDRLSGHIRQYFNYAGVPAPAITDVDALPTCP